MGNGDSLQGLMQDFWNLPCSTIRNAVREIQVQSVLLYEDLHYETSLILTFVLRCFFHEDNKTKRTEAINVQIWTYELIPWSTALFFLQIDSISASQVIPF